MKVPKGENKLQIPNEESTEMKGQMTRVPFISKLCWLKPL